MRVFGDTVPIPMGKDHSLRTERDGRKRCDDRYRSIGNVQAVRFENNASQSRITNFGGSKRPTETDIGIATK